jgi:prepilin-type N-terminal cleavage/methylation domain-containing protein
MKVLCHRNNRGYTLTEVLIAIVIGIILITGISATYISQNRSYVTQESVSEVNTQSKIAHDMIVYEIKSAGFEQPVDLNQEPINGFSTVVSYVDSTSSTDAITIVSGRMIGTLWPVSSSSSIPCPSSVPRGTTSVSIVFSGTDAPNTTDANAISIDGVDFYRITNCTINAGGTCDSSPITIDPPLTQDFPLVDTDGDGLCDTGRPVYLVQATTFCVDGNSILRRIRGNVTPATCTPIGNAQNDAIAENIEDLQFAYALDADEDGQIDDLNGDSVIEDADFVNGVSFSDPNTIRAVRINILARADRPDPNYRGLGSRPTSIENHAFQATSDDFRRRWWQTIVKIRND